MLNAQKRMYGKAKRSPKKNIFITAIIRLPGTSNEGRCPVIEL